VDSELSEELHGGTKMSKQKHRMFNVRRKQVGSVHRSRSDASTLLRNVGYQRGGVHRMHKRHQPTRKQMHVSSLLEVVSRT
jgi:hypothetical protein